jgi:hypothetical protein
VDKGDPIVGHAKSAISTLVEPMTGYLILRYLRADHGALAVQEAMITR